MLKKKIFENSEEGLHSIDVNIIDGELKTKILLVNIEKDEKGLEKYNRILRKYVKSSLVLKPAVFKLSKWVEYAYDEIIKTLESELQSKFGVDVISFEISPAVENKFKRQLVRLFKEYIVVNPGNRVSGKEIVIDEIIAASGIFKPTFKINVVDKERMINKNIRFSFENLLGILSIKFTDGVDFVVSQQKFNVRKVRSIYPINIVNALKYSIKGKPEKLF